MNKRNYDMLEDLLEQHDVAKKKLDEFIEKPSITGESYNAVKSLMEMEVEMYAGLIEEYRRLQDV